MVVVVDDINIESGKGFGGKGGGGGGYFCCQGLVKFYKRKLIFGFSSWFENLVSIQMCMIMNF